MTRPVSHAGFVNHGDDIATIGAFGGGIVGPDRKGARS